MANPGLVMACNGYNKTEVCCHHAIQGTPAAAAKAWIRICDGQPLLYYSTKVKFFRRREQRESADAV